MEGLRGGWLLVLAGCALVALIAWLVRAVPATDEPPSAHSALGRPAVTPSPVLGDASIAAADDASGGGSSGAVCEPLDVFHGAPAPYSPTVLQESEKPTLVLLTAVWCMWCDTFEKKVLTRPDIQRQLASFRTLLADVDRDPVWMDLEGVSGLPSLAFFDRGARHVLTLSGYKSPAEMLDVLKVVQQRLQEGAMTPYAGRKALDHLPDCALKLTEARATLRRFEGKVFMAINSNDGGFATPARIPHPDLLRELAEWAQLGAPARVTQWVEKTAESALVGRSPRLEGEPLPDFTLSHLELARLAAEGSAGGELWFDNLKRLQNMDPFQGLQDPVDHGVFRYAAGPGWYNPHFERRAMDNLSWAILLNVLGKERQGQQIASFVEQAFHRGDLLGSVQQANPFYYRLRAAERRGISSPAVDELWLLEVQARAARVNRARCHQLRRVPLDAWPKGRWNKTGEEPSAPPALPDAVGELLLALRGCGGEYASRGEQLSATLVQQWREGKIPILGNFARLHRLAAGICAAAPKRCGAVLAAIADLPFDPQYAPPLVALAKYANSAPPDRPCDAPAQ